MRLVFDLMHNCIAHPLMAILRYPKWSEQFHDWTAKKAWPEGETP